MLISESPIFIYLHLRHLAAAFVQTWPKSSTIIHHCLVVQQNLNRTSFKSTYFIIASRVNPLLVNISRVATIRCLHSMLKRYFKCFKHTSQFGGRLQQAVSTFCIATESSSPGCTWWTRVNGHTAALWSLVYTLPVLVCMEQRKPSVWSGLKPCSAHYKGCPGLALKRQLRLLLLLLLHSSHSIRRGGWCEA